MMKTREAENGKALHHTCLIDVRRAEGMAEVTPAGRSFARKM